MRLRTLERRSGGLIRLRWRAFPLRPVPDPTATFRGTYREAAWARAQALAGDTGIEYRMWARPDYPTWSLPALDAAKCVALQGPEAFERVHLALYRAFFTEGVNIGRPEEVVGVIERIPGVDLARFRDDYEAGRGREAVLADAEAAASEHGVRAVPTVILPDGRRIVGAVPLAEYERLLGL